MSKPEWGVKRLCPSCSALYYDMKKNPPVCPKCGTGFDPEALLKSRRKVTPEDMKPKKAAVPDIEEITEDVEVEEVAGDDVAAEEIEDGDEEIEVDVDVEEKDA